MTATCVLEVLSGAQLNVKLCLKSNKGIYRNHFGVRALFQMLRFSKFHFDFSMFYKIQPYICNLLFVHCLYPILVHKEFVVYKNIFQ